MKILAVCLGLLCLCVPAEAHRLALRWEFQAGTLRLTGTTDGLPAAGADIEIRSASGEVLTNGVLDAAGAYSWTPGQGSGALRVVVNAGLGHRRTLELTAQDLEPARGPETAAGAHSQAPIRGQAEEAPGRRGSNEDASSLALRVVLGLTFLLAAAGAWMGWSNSRRLHMLERRGGGYAGRG